MIVTLTENFIVQGIFSSLVTLMDKLPLIVSIAVVCTAMYFGFKKRAMLVSGVLSTIKKLTRRR